MEFEEILKKTKNREINCEQAMESLSKIGMCPNLLNDDNGHWAVTFDGFQTVPFGDDPTDVTTTLFIEAKEWKNSIYEALIWSLEGDE